MEHVLHCKLDWYTSTRLELSCFCIQAQLGANWPISMLHFTAWKRMNTDLKQNTYVLISHSSNTYIGML